MVEVETSAVLEEDGVCLQASLLLLWLTEPRLEALNPAVQTGNERKIATDYLSVCDEVCRAFKLNIGKVCRRT